MRLIDVRSDHLVLREFWGHDIPPYAILSHTWGDEEISFADIQERDPELYMNKKGYNKIENTCRQAEEDKLDWVWVDTVCIDKSSSAELSEAINSMFRWYQMAKVCYAYLVDVDQDGASSLLFSRWWTRGRFQPYTSLSHSTDLRGNRLDPPRTCCAVNVTIL